MREALEFYAGYNKSTNPHYQAREQKKPMTTNDDYAKAYNLYLNGKFQELEKLYQATTEDQAGCLLATHYWHQNNSQAALNILNKHLGYFEANVITIAVFISLNRLDDAINRINDLYIKFSEYDAVIQYFEALAQVTLSQKPDDLQNSFHAFQEIYQIYGHNDNIANLLVITCMKLNNFQDAEQWNNKIQGFKPTENALLASTHQPFDSSSIDKEYEKAIQSLK